MFKKKLNMNILLIGVSSFLGQNLLLFLKSKGYTVTTVSQHLGQKIPYDELDKFSSVIYLKPDADSEFIEYKVKDKVPVLAIGSGALVDFYAGRLKLNPYIEGKQKIVSMASCTIHPGFFIPSPNHVDTGRGLHRDTLITLFSGNQISDSFNMDKSYYMTPVDKLLELILIFVKNPKQYVGEYAFGTHMPISRSQLLTLESTPQTERIYEEEMKHTKDVFNIEVTDEDIKNFKHNASEWVQNFS